MTGWRIGFASNPVLAPVLTRWITNTDSCASQISQWAAVEAVNGPQDAAEMMKKSFLERRDFIHRLAERHPGRELPAARRRVLCLAERHRGLPHDRRQGLGGVHGSAC
jgi:aspartate aminotransferase